MNLKTASKLLATLLFMAFFSLQATAQDEVIKEGRFISKGYRISGNFQLVKTERGIKIVLDERFRTNNGPDLKIFLSKDNHRVINNNNADLGVKVGLLKSNQGYQEYYLNPRVDISRYKTLIIHCERFSKLWGVADISQK